MAVLGLEKLRLRRAQESRFGRGGRRVALRGPRGGDGLRQGHAEVEVVDEYLQDGRDDRRAPRGAEGEDRLSVLRDYRGAHAAPRALAAVRGVGEPWYRLEVRKLVVQDEAVVWDRDRAPPRLLD